MPGYIRLLKQIESDVPTSNAYHYLVFTTTGSWGTKFRIFTGPWSRPYGDHLEKTPFFTKFEITWKFVLPLESSMILILSCVKLFIWYDDVIENGDGVSIT